MLSVTHLHSLSVGQAGASVDNGRNIAVAICRLTRMNRWPSCRPLPLKRYTYSFIILSVLLLPTKMLEMLLDIDYEIRRKCDIKRYVECLACRTTSLCCRFRLLTGNLLYIRVMSTAVDQNSIEVCDQVLFKILQCHAIYFYPQILSQPSSTRSYRPQSQDLEPLCVHSD